MVPLFDLTRQYQGLKSQIDGAVLDLLESGRFVLGPAVEEFEAAAAHYLNVKHAIGVANGTDALLLSLRSLGLKAGDEVITTPFTFIATAEVVSLLGATPVFVDIEPDTFNINPSLIEAAITPHTRGIIPVHLFGHPAPMDEIHAIAKSHNLFVLEDAAQAWGARMSTQSGEKSCGALADMGAFSFFLRRIWARQARADLLPPTMMNCLPTRKCCVCTDRVAVTTTMKLVITRVCTLCRPLF
jgi:dTDP-4-amino-4,6-dideoxygalactose transaminase